MDQHSVRIFRDSTSIFLSLVEPGRGNQVITHLLDRLLGPANYFIDSLELNRAALQSYVQRFQSFKLVAAKIRDFQAYEKAIARLEISGKDGIADDIAPFVAGKFYRIDSLTYEVIHDFQKGLVTYFANGTLRVTQSLVHIAFPIFEDHLRSGV
jgi:hypothetical protein